MLAAINLSDYLSVGFLVALRIAEGERQQYKTKRFICDSQDLTLHAVLSDGNNTVRYTLEGGGRTNGASLVKSRGGATV